MKIDEKNYLKELCNKNEKVLEYVIDNYSAIVNVVIRNVLRFFENEGLIEECISDVFFGVWDNIYSDIENHVIQDKILIGNI